MSEIPSLHITAERVEKLLAGVNPANAVGPFLQVLFQHSINSDTLADDWLNANISPVSKKVMYIWLKTIVLRHM